MAAKKSWADLYERARAAGFADLALLPATNPGPAFVSFFQDYLASGRQAGMHYLASPARFDLQAILPGARSLVVFLSPYLHPLTLAAQKQARYQIASFAWGRDYHQVVKQRLQELLADFEGCRVVIDSAPVAERYLARQAGLGFLGKNGLLIHPELGSYFHIAVALLVDEFDLAGQMGPESDPRRADQQQYCQSCRACIEACPGQALSGDGLLDARRCFSYLTIEARKEEIVLEPARPTRYIFGCDICQNVCPFNASPVFTQQQQYAPLEYSVHLSQGLFPATGLRQTSFYRTGLAKLQKNLQFIGQFLP